MSKEMILNGSNRAEMVASAVATFAALKGAEFTAFAKAAIILRTAESKTKGRTELMGMFLSAGYTAGTAANYSTKAGHMAEDEHFKAPIDPALDFEANVAIVAPILQGYWGNVNDVTAKGPRGERAKPNKKAPAAGPAEGDTTLPADTATVIGFDKLRAVVTAQLVNLDKAQLLQLQGIIEAELSARDAADTTSEAAPVSLAQAA